MSKTRLATPSLETVVVLAVAAVGVVATAAPIGDNSMLLHLRTGMEIVRTGSVPTVDPYSYTAGGTPWTVQSWFAEALYGLLDRLAGLHAVVLLQMLLTGLTAFLIATLARTGAMVRTTVAAATAVAFGFPYWTERPLLFGLLCLAVAVWVYERKANPVVLLPIGWLWVNTHGSFPLIVIYLGARLVGELLDGRSPSELEWRYPAWMAAGIGFGALNPFGLSLLTFPFRTLSGKAEVFAAINEWKAPDFHSLPGQLLLVPLIVTVLILARRRVDFAYVLPFAAFLALALYSQRNMPALAIVVAPALAAALREATAGESDKGDPLIRKVATGVIAVAVLAASARVLSLDPLDLTDYPVAELAAVDQRLGSDARVLMPDWVAGYRVYDKGTEAGVFIDDRYDMFPVELSLDYVALARGTGEDPGVILPKYDLQAVVWQNERALTYWLAASPEWERISGDGDWAVFVRR